jgi:outer membrane protein assembly factor BamB
MPPPPPAPDVIYEWKVICLDAASGKMLWEQTAHEGKPTAAIHRNNTYASETPATDGEHLFAFFGSFGLYCLSVEGELIWKADFGPMQSLHGHGEGSSPVLYKDTLIVNWDHEGSSFVVALDKRTGQERWKVKRNEVTSWATPIIVEHAEASRPPVAAAVNVSAGTGKL